MKIKNEKVSFQRLWLCEHLLGGVRRMYETRWFSIFAGSHIHSIFSFYNFFVFFFFPSPACPFFAGSARRRVCFSPSVSRTVEDETRLARGLPCSPREGLYRVSGCIMRTERAGRTDRRRPESPSERQRRVY